MVAIHPIIQGIHTAETRGEQVFLPNHTSAVTLLQADSTNILVDVGGRGTMGRITQGLSAHGLTPDDIHLIILTHLHLDHCYNVAFFTQAQVYAWNHDWTPSGTLRFNTIETAPLPSGIQIIKTPGHMLEHLTVLVTTDNGERVALVGDSFNEHYMRTDEINNFCADEPAYRKSADWVLSIADRVIPGHGPVFDVIKPTESRRQTIAPPLEQ